MLTSSIFTWALPGGKAKCQQLQDTDLKSSRKRESVSQYARYQELHLFVLAWIICPSLNIMIWFCLVSGVTDHPSLDEEFSRGHLLLELSLKG